MPRRRTGTVAVICIHIVCAHEPTTTRLALYFVGYFVCVIVIVTVATLTSTRATPHAPARYSVQERHQPPRPRHGQGQGPRHSPELAGAPCTLPLTLWTHGHMVVA
jgi:hypothetical protein